MNLLIKQNKIIYYETNKKKRIGKKRKEREREGGRKIEMLRKNNLIQSRRNPEHDPYHA